MPHTDDPHTDSMADHDSEGELQAQRAKLKTQLESLKKQHRELDTEITALRNIGSNDILKTQRMKKQKLVLKDKIAYIENQLTPDIIA